MFDLCNSILPGNCPDVLLSSTSPSHNNDHELMLCLNLVDCLRFFSPHSFIIPNKTNRAPKLSMPQARLVQCPYFGLLPIALILFSSCQTSAFVPIQVHGRIPRQPTTFLPMAMDMVTYLRTEWIAAALCTNQTPRSADVCLQLGTEDGRIVTFVPRTIRQIITSSAEPDGTISVGARRQLKKNEDIRQCAKVQIVDQPADDLFQVQDNSIDVVVSLQCAQRMLDNGKDWKKAVREACRVLKPGGRFLWVEPTTVNGESFLSYLENLYTQINQDDGSKTTTDSIPLESEVSTKSVYPTFDDIGWDDINLVLIPHTAGVAIKAMDPSDVQSEEQKEKARIDDLSLTAFERGLKKRKKKKKKTQDTNSIN